MAKIRIHYTEYKNSPKATRVSRLVAGARYILCILLGMGGIGCVLTFIFDEHSFRWLVYGLLFIGAFYLVCLLSGRFEEWRVERILAKEKENCKYVPSNAKPIEPVIYNTERNLGNNPSYGNSDNSTVVEYCGKCGKELPPNTKYCPYCGLRIR